MKINPLSYYPNNKTSTFPTQRIQVASHNVIKQEDSPVQFKDNNDFNVKTAIAGAAGLAVAGLVAFAAVQKGKGVSSLDVVSDVDTKKIKNMLSDIIITDKEKFKKIISNFTHDDYDVAKNFKVNLHMHSTMSDGQMTPLEILEQARKRAEQLPISEKFTFSLTDHDSIEGVKIIAEEITKNPEKYSKLNFIPGLELSVKFKNKSLAENSMPMDFLIYAFDLNDEHLIKQLSKRKSYLIQKTQELFDDFNKLSNADFSVEKMRKESDNGLLKNVASNGYVKALVEYIDDIVKKKELKLPVKKSILEKFGDEHFSFEANLNLDEAVKLTKESNAFCSIAHPGKLNTKHLSLYNNNHLEVTDNIVKTFIDAGGDGIETHYMAYKEGNLDWWSRIRASFKKFNFHYDRTGGYDCHGKTIYSKS